MNIFAYEVRGDEIAAFDWIEQVLNIRIHRCPDPLTAQNLRLCAGCDAVTILGHSALNRQLLLQLQKAGIRVVSTRTVGSNHIDLAAAKDLGIAVCNTHYGPQCVADYTVMLLLICLRNYKPALWRMQVNDYSLNGLQGRQVGSLTIGIVGTGRIGRQVMQNLSGFGCKFLCYDPFPHPDAEKLGQYVSLEEIWNKCDVISFHTPQTQENYHMVNRETLAKMKDGVILINTARGELMDVEALIEGIENRKIGRLAMDVFTEEEGIYHENLRDSIIKNRSMAYLRQFPNVIMTPHIAFYTEEAVQSMVENSVRGIFDLITTGNAATRLV